MIHFCSGYLTFIWGKCKRSQHSIRWTIVAALNELHYSNNSECSDPCHGTGLDSWMLYWSIREEIWRPRVSLAAFGISNWIFKVRLGTQSLFSNFKETLQDSTWKLAMISCWCGSWSQHEHSSAFSLYFLALVFWSEFRNLSFRLTSAVTTERRKNTYVTFHVNVDCSS